MRKWHTFKVDPARVTFVRCEARPYAVGGSYDVLVDGEKVGVVSKVRASNHRYSDSGRIIVGTSHSWHRYRYRPSRENPDPRPEGE